MSELLVVKAEVLRVFPPQVLDKEVHLVWGQLWGAAAEVEQSQI